MIGFINLIIYATLSYGLIPSWNAFKLFDCFFQSYHVLLLLSIISFLVSKTLLKLTISLFGVS